MITSPTFDALTALLVDEVARIGEAPIYESANTAETNRGAPGVCWHCRKPGHCRDRCFELHLELKNKGGGLGTRPLPKLGGRRGLLPERADMAIVVASPSATH